MDQKAESNILLLQETHLSSQNKHRRKNQSLGDNHANNSLKNAGMVILISDDTNIRLKKFIRDKDEYFVIIKGYVRQEEITFLNVCTQLGTRKYLVKMLPNLKEDINSNTKIVGDVNTALSPWDRSTRLKPNMNILSLKGEIEGRKWPNRYIHVYGPRKLIHILLQYI